MMNASAEHRKDSAESARQTSLAHHPERAIATTIALLIASVVTTPHQPKPEAHNDGRRPIVATSVHDNPTAIFPDSLDVNGDGTVDATDALLTIHTLNDHSPYDEATDVNDDGRNSPLDALLIIDHLNKRH